MATKRLYPKRTRAQALRVVIRFYGIAILAALLVHFIWTRIELQKYSLAVEQLRLAGEPGTLGDLNRPMANDPGNPVPEWRAAFRAIDSSTSVDSQSFFECVSFEFPVTIEEAAKLRAIVTANRSVLEHAKTAAAMQGQAEWAVHFVSPAIDSLFPDLNQQRTVCDLVSVAALDAHYRSSDGEALERIGQVLAAERSMSRYPGMIGHLVSRGFGGLADSLVKRVAPDLTVQSTGDPDGRSASITQVRNICRELLDESWRRGSLRNTCQSDRVMEADDVMRVAGLDMTHVDPSESEFQTAGWGARLKRYVLKPVVYANGCDMLDVGRTISRLPQSPDWPTFQTSFAQLPDFSRVHFFAKFLVETKIVSWQRAMMCEYRSTTDNRMAAVQLALRLYAINHDNALPVSLDALVPAYLPAVPLDPMTIGQPLRYKSGSDPIIYSVGLDGVDDGGNETPNDPKIRDNPWEQKDYVVHLNRRPRVNPPVEDPSPASTQP